MKRTIYINTICEMNIIKACGIEADLKSFITPGGRHIYWIEVELNKKQINELQKKGIGVL